MKEFATAEDLKWHYHKLYVKTGVDMYRFLMEHCNTAKEANEEATILRQPFRVKET